MFRIDHNLIAAALLVGMAGVALTGCIHGTKAYARQDNCLACHAANNTAGNTDLSRFYGASKETHHKVDVAYPSAEVEKGSDLIVLTAIQGDMLFADRNGNGAADTDEVRLYMVKEAYTVTCASCHREHAGAAGMTGKSDRIYLRGTNTASEMCMACHRK
jgi:mono/diheme cytochrome c family protein